MYFSFLLIHSSLIQHIPFSGKLFFIGGEFIQGCTLRYTFYFEITENSKFPLLVFQLVSSRCLCVPLETLDCQPVETVPFVLMQCRETAMGIDPMIMGADCDSVAVSDTGSCLCAKKKK